MRFRAILVICLMPVLLAFAGRVQAQESPPSEYRIKAAFLFNFAKFVEWPESAFADKSSPFVIGILGDSPFGSDLEQTVNGKKVNDRPFEIRQLKSTAEASKCHILFICTSEKKHLPDIVKTLDKGSVLTVGETEEFTKEGGMINFLMVDNKIRFLINDSAARQAGLKISPKLLTLALHTAH